jgi:hypothetical protein
LPATSSLPAGGLTGDGLWWALDRLDGEYRQWGDLWHEIDVEVLRHLISAPCGGWLACTAGEVLERFQRFGYSVGTLMRATGRLRREVIHRLPCPDTISSTQLLSLTFAWDTWAGPPDRCA